MSTESFAKNADGQTFSRPKGAPAGLALSLAPSLALACPPATRHRIAMADANKLTREERLAAKLRENLRRRKAQARALEDDAGGESGESLPKGPPSR